MPSTAPPTRGLAALLDAAVTAQITPGAQLEVGTIDGPLCSLCAGSLHANGDAPPVTPSTRFDLASVTKPLAVGMLMKRALSSGRAHLDMTLADALGPLTPLPPDKAPLRLDDLLCHRAGFAAWLPFFERVPPDLRHTPAGRDWIRAATLAHPLASPPGAQERYTDLGFILLAWALEALLGDRLDALFAAEVASPLGLSLTGFVPHGWGAHPLPDAVWTERVPWRGGFVRGLVHDDNTAAMGGVSGHAGLFSTASDLGAIARALLSLDAHTGPTHWIHPRWVHRFWDRADLLPNAHHLRAWDSPSGDISGAGLLSTRAQTVGHLGFTGTSLWIDRRRRAYVALLTSRVYPTRDAPRIRTLRPLLHDTAWALVDALSPPSAP